MKVYIVVFEGAHGLQIDKVFTDKQKAIRWINEQHTGNYIYHYEIQEFFAE